MNKVKAGMIALVVAVATGAAAYALSDKHNRKKIRRALEDAKDMTIDVVDDVEKKTRPLRKEAEKRFEEARMARSQRLVN